MDTLLVAVFDSEREARDGFRAIKDLHAEGSVSLYDVALVAKDAGGKPAVRSEAAEWGPVGTLVGLLTGGALGLPGGPVGVALGATAGTMGGALYDLATVGVSGDFLERVATRLEPGKAAVVAEIGEEEVRPVDNRLEAAGGVVYRRARADLAGAQIERDAAALSAELGLQRAELDREGEEARARLQGRVDAARAELRAIQERAQAWAEATQREVAAKITVLAGQAGGARAERKQQIEQRLAEVQADCRERTAKLERAGELIREALRPGRADEDGELPDGCAVDTNGHPAIERVREGMIVVGADGREIGKVALLRMGDPEAVTTRGEERPGILFGHEMEPKVPEPLRSGLLRLGYLKVERHGVLGIGEKDHYVRADRIADVSGDRVLLTVNEAQLPDQYADETSGHR